MSFLSVSPTIPDNTKLEDAIPSDCFITPKVRFPPFTTLHIYFTPSHQTRPFELSLLLRSDSASFWFCPPHCYQLSSARTSSLLRDHLPPHTHYHLESPLGHNACLSPRFSARLPRLLHWLPVRYSVLKHIT